MLASALEWLGGRSAFAVLAIVVAGLSNTASAYAATISFDPEASETACDQQVSVDVVVDDVSDLRGFSLELAFSSTFVDLIAVNAGPDLVGAPCPHFFYVFPYVAGSTTVKFDGAGLGCSLAGPARIATLVFQGASEGLASLDCDFVDLRNGLNLPVPSTCQSATILVSCPIPVSEENWGMLKTRWR
jgi:hypothetical protein